MGDNTLAPDLGEGDGLIYRGTSLDAIPGSDRTTKDGKKVEGCIVLGKNAPGHNVYYTHYLIDRVDQRKIVWKELFLDSLCPCAEPDGRRNPGIFLWSIIKCEPFLVTLHLTAVLLGVFKAVVHTKAVSFELHIMHSVLETIGANLVVIIRTVNVKTRFKDIKTFRESVEYIPGSGESRTLKRWITMCIIIATMLVIFSISCFIGFYFIDQLEWTILSNNFIMIVGTVLTNVTLDRLNGVINRIKEDQHKAVIYETVTLLMESLWIDQSDEKAKIQENATRFCKALQETPAFQQPDYIKADGASKPKWDTITALQLESFI